MKYENYVSVTMDDKENYVVYFTCNSASLATCTYLPTESQYMLTQIHNWIRFNKHPLK